MLRNGKTKASKIQNNPIIKNKVTKGDMMIVEITPIGEIKPKIRADKNPVNEMALIDDERELPR